MNKPNHHKPVLIWDLDGTLLDSYEVILSGLYAVCQDYHFPYDEKKIKKQIIDYSVNHYLEELAESSGISFIKMKDRCSEVTRKNNKYIKLMPHAKELLNKLKELGIDNYVFTHRGVSTEEVLKNTGIHDYFVEIITSLSGYKRKPEPEALLYLLNKYHLDPNNTYYVGDRNIDMIAANNAHIKSILYLPDNNVATPTGKETHIIKDLLEILDIIK